jgi:hypothetical protein
MSGIIHARDVAIAFILISTIDILIRIDMFVKNQNWELITIMAIILSGPVCLVLWVLRVAFERIK